MTAREHSEEYLLRADLYRLLSLAFSYPSEESVDLMRTISGELAGGEVSAVTQFDRFREVLGRTNVATMVEEYSRLFLRGAVSLAETSYSSEFNPIADIAAYYEAFGVRPRSGDSPDSLPYELEFLAFLGLKAALASTDEALEVASEAHVKFIRDHTGPFALAFARRLFEMEPCEFYGVTGHMLTEAIRLDYSERERSTLNVVQDIDLLLEADSKCGL